jgi:saccharopine dehydrogenase-like NADP-dependent oxidoreductase
MLDRYDRQTDTSSMARTTGYTCTAIVHLVARGQYKHVGISPSEFVGRDIACFEQVVRYLDQRGVSITHSTEAVEVKDAR